MIDQINDIRPKSCDQAAELITAAAHVRLTVIPASESATWFGPDIADLRRFMHLSKKALLAGCCCALLLVALPIYTYSLHVARQNQVNLEVLHRERASAQGVLQAASTKSLKKEQARLSLDAQLNAQRTTLAEERSKYAQSLKVQREIHHNETKLQARTWESQLATEHTKEAQLATSLMEERSKLAEERTKFVRNITDAKAAY